MKSNQQLDIDPLLEPWLKDFLDSVIVPALLREFMKSVLDSSRDARGQSLEEAPKGEPE
jgi:hypothetical protein